MVFTQILKQQGVTNLKSIRGGMKAWKKGKSTSGHDRAQVGQVEGVAVCPMCTAADHRRNRLYSEILRRTIADVMLAQGVCCCVCCCPGLGLVPARHGSLEVRS
jgi:hypothetical protein